MVHQSSVSPEHPNPVTLLAEFIQEQAARCTADARTILADMVGLCSECPSMIVQLTLKRKDLTHHARYTYRAEQVLLWDVGHTYKDIEMVSRVIFVDDSGYRKILKDRRPDEPTTLVIERPYFMTYDSVRTYLQEIQQRITNHKLGLPE